MTALLPPDPTRTAGWWVQCGISDPVIATWDAYDQRWFMPGSDRAHEVLHRYTLASPHPIPTAAQLDALHALAEKWKDKALHERDAHWVMAAHTCIDDLCATLKGGAP